MERAAIRYGCRDGGNHARVETLVVCHEFQNYSILLVEMEKLLLYCSEASIAAKAVGVVLKK